MLFPHVDQGCVSLGVGVFSLAMKDAGLFATSYMGFVVLVGRFTSLQCDSRSIDITFLTMHLFSKILWHHKIVDYSVKHEP